MSAILYYVHDPLCSWCYAFGPVWRQLQAQLPDGVRVERLLGGLAPDTDIPMESAMRDRLEATWHRIEKSVPGTTFNFDFWKVCTPYRTTYPACRAVIAATQLAKAGGGERMNTAIQQAYYRQARNPALTETLIDIAEEIGLQRNAFASTLASNEVEEALQRQIGFSSQIGAESYPALILAINEHTRWPIAIDYNDPAPMLDTLLFLLDEGRD